MSEIRVGDRVALNADHQERMSAFRGMAGTVRGLRNGRVQITWDDVDRGRYQESWPHDAVEIFDDPGLQVHLRDPHRPEDG